jgi:CRISPR-associated protein (TIGR03986 family)
MITAPYNFVPLNKEVFYPSWSKDGKEVSHDIPFEDGESGEIDITITAKSPIFIRNHYQDGDEYYEMEKDKKKIKVSKEFCHLINENGAKEFYIPGSSIKGMVRSVLEILSFSKMKVDEDKLKKPLSIRDMTPTKYCADTSIKIMKDCPEQMKKDLFEHKMVGTANGIGLLKINPDGSGTITDYTVEEKSGFQIKYGIRTIKYDQLSSIGYTNDLRKKDFDEKYKIIEPYSKIKVTTVKQAINRRYIATFNNIGEDAIVILNSYIDGKDDGKKYEFILCPSDKKQSIKIDKTLIDSFKTTYFSCESKLGDFWKKQLNTKDGQKYGIPVFLMKSNKGTIQAIGLTQLFKLSYKKTLFDAAKQITKISKLDLAETIFGTEKDKLALKGRVQFSHLKSTTERYEKQVDAILGSPNPTYYPNYIKQDGQNEKVSKYKTLMDADAVISGWKRYPLHSQTMSSGESSDKEAVKTHFKPLESGTIFKGKLRFHNLKKAEIGALLSAITFHGQSEKCMHNIGMAKPLGYGKIDIQLTFRNLKYSQNEYLQEFENEITKEIKDWRNTQQLKELFAMAGVNTKSNEYLAYQLLENPKSKYYGEKNDFTGAKKAREYLVPHSFNMPKNVSSKPQNIQQQPKIYLNTQKPKQEQSKTSDVDVIAQIYEAYAKNILQVYNALKNGHLSKYRFDKKILAKKLLEDMSKDENLVKSQKQKDLDRFEYLKNILK